MTNNPFRDEIDQLEKNIEEEEAFLQDVFEEIESLESLLSPEAQKLTKDLRPVVVADDVYSDLEEVATFGERLADYIAEFAGSWGFIIGFALFMIVWIGINLILRSRAFDTYPFILLNLGLSTLAALQAPVILMSQNRQAAKDRAVAQNDYQVNLKSELEIADLHRKVDRLSDLLNQQMHIIQQLISVSDTDDNAQQSNDVKS